MLLVGKDCYGRRFLRLRASLGVGAGSGDPLIHLGCIGDADADPHQQAVDVRSTGLATLPAPRFRSSTQAADTRAIAAPRSPDGVFENQ